MASPHIAVRYWLARALGKSRKQETYQDLLTLLNASQPNVVCQALYSIGQRGDSDAIDNILQVMGAFDHWYVQRYAYQALRELGWKHRRST
jgi:HEAT repeat protein